MWGLCAEPAGDDGPYYATDVARHAMLRRRRGLGRAACALRRQVVAYSGSETHQQSAETVI